MENKNCVLFIYKILNEKKVDENVLSEPFSIAYVFIFSAKCFKEKFFF